MNTFISKESLIGLAIAIIIVSLWIGSLFYFLSIPLNHLSLTLILVGVLIRTILHTGLFVIGHDAMHMNLIPENKFINNLIGSLVVKLYAFLPYKQCCINHSNHHRKPAQSGDPDFHDGIHTDPIHWYLKFMREYLPGSQIFSFLAIWIFAYLILTQCFEVNGVIFLLFGLLPLCLSSLQLFYFGTYLPHRENEHTLKISQRINHGNHSDIWSFLTCYHFGFYHTEHHHSPKTPWHKLPALSREKENKISFDNRFMRENLL